jgi:hypothetical protein
VSLYLETITLKAANAFVASLHRHHKPVVGHKFSLSARREGSVVGVVILGRPVARARDNGLTIEATRLCTDGTRNACSFLYGAAIRATWALGYDRFGTYTLPSEGGSSLRAVGLICRGERGGGSWDTPTRRREDHAPLDVKWLWEAYRTPLIRELYEARVL